MYFKYQNFSYHSDVGTVEIAIDPKRGYARVFAPPGTQPDNLLRTLLEERSWQIHTVAMSASRNAINAYLLRGDALLNFLKHAGTHNDTALSMVPNEWHTRVKVQRLHESYLREELLEQAGRPGKTEAAGVLAYCTSTKRFLMQKRAADIPTGGKWAGFGGHLERRETPAEAAQREFKEETGLIVSAEKLVPLWVFENDDLIFYNHLLLINQEYPCIIDPEETEDYKWVSFKELSKLDLLDGVTALFDNDPILKEIILTENNRPASFANIVDRLMGKNNENPDDPSPLVA